MSNFSGGGTQNNNPIQSIVGGQAVPGLADAIPDTIINEVIEINIPPVDISSNPDDVIGSRDALRILFPGTNAFLPYQIGRALVGEGQGVEFFIVAFDTTEGGLTVPIQIPLVGQTINELVRQINAKPGLKAEVLNGAFDVPADFLLPTGSKNITLRWANFTLSDDIGVLLGDPSKDIHFFFTSIEPGIQQNNPLQSVGGYVSPTNVYPSASLTKAVSFYDKTLFFDSVLLSQFSIIALNDEVITISSWQNNIAYVDQRSAFETPIRFHATGSVARGLSKNDILNQSFSQKGKQYRCIAIKNTGSKIIRDVKVFFKLSSRNTLSDTLLAVEIPRFEYKSIRATSGTNSTFTISSYAGQFTDNHFKSGAVTFFDSNANQIRTIVSYDGASGTFTLDAPLPNAVKFGDTIVVDTAPSQRISSGTIPPKTTNDQTTGLIITPLQDATFISNSISINVGKTRTNGSDMKQNDVIYVWIERSVDSINDFFGNNRSILAISYK